MIIGQGEMEVTESGAKRESNAGRGRFDLLPYEAMEAWAKWSEEGANKYGDRNWEKGLSIKDCINRMCRHAMKAANGWTDEDHLAATMWNAAAAITMMQRYPDRADHIWHTNPEPISTTKLSDDDITFLRIALESGGINDVETLSAWLNRRKGYSNQDENGMELKKPNPPEFMAKTFNIPCPISVPEFMKKKRAVQVKLTGSQEQHLEKMDDIRKLRWHLEELLHTRELNGVLTWLETHALRDVCNHLLHLDMTLNDGIPEELRILAKKEIETLS